MKKPFLLFAFLLFLLQCFGQSAAEQVPTKSDYLNKSKRQRTTGFVMLGGGLATTLLGFAMASAEVLNGNTEESVRAEIVAFAGIGAMVGSIPVLISAGKNKRRAAGSISFSNQKLVYPHQKCLAVKALPSLTLKVPL